jgi:predicted PurR-regulated permease PerM
MCLGIVISVAAGFFLLGVIDNASRTIGWIVFSASIALMLYPAANAMAKIMPRSVAVILLLLLVVTLIVAPIYSVVDDVNSQTKKLEQTLPARAHALEQKGRFAKSFKEFELEKKTREAIKKIPDALQGGSKAERIKANANRVIAFLAGGVLMLFLLLYGNKLVSGALSVINDEEQKKKIEALLAHAYKRATIFGWSQIGLSVAAALFTYVTCRIAGIPAAGLLATWVALWNIIPVFGVVVGTLPVVILAGAQSITLAWVLLAIFIAYEVVESLARHRLLGPHALRLDAIITIVVVFGGIELYGLGGALAGLVIASFLHALASEFAAQNPE